MNKKNVAGLVAAYLWVSGGLLDAADGQAVQAPKPTGTVEVVSMTKIDPANPPAMEVKVAAWKPTEPAQDAKPVGMLLMNKGAGHEDWVIKMVSVCDQNNIWCVANDGAKDAVYQLTSKGLVHRFDGVSVAAGKGIVAAINDQHEVFELEGGTGTAWKKVDGLKLTKISRPNAHVGWGLLEDNGAISFFSYDEDNHKWNIVKNASGQPAKGIVACSANAEDVVLAMNDKGELMKSDLQRMQLYEKAKAVMKAPKKENEKKEAGKKGGKEQKHHGKNQKKHGKSDKEEKFVYEGKRAVYGERARKLAQQEKRKARAKKKDEHHDEEKE